MILDPFSNKSAFSLTTLTLAINSLPVTPTRLASLGLYEEQGVSTLTVQIESKNGSLSIVEIRPRGAPGSGLSEEDRVIMPFGIPHLPQEESVMADEVQGKRRFGSEDQSEVLADRINEKLAIMRRNIDYTMEAHRMTNIKGMFYDINGSAHSLFTTFGVNQQHVDMHLDSTDTKVRQVCMDIILAVKNGLGSQPYNSIRVLCGTEFWKDLIAHPDVERSYLNTVQASELRGSPTKSFEFGGVNWEWYDGNSDVKIEDDNAYAFPMGVPGLFITRFAPAPYAETVNTVGLPYYAKSVPMKFDVGRELQAQSNPLNLVTRPAAIVKLWKTAKP